VIGLIGTLIIHNIKITTVKKISVKRSIKPNGSTIGAHTYHYIISVDGGYGYSYTMTKAGYVQLLDLFGKDCEVEYTEVE
jgi:hypothetical protein